MVNELDEKRIEKRLREIDKQTYDICGPADITLCSGDSCRSKDTCLRFLLNKTGGKVFIHPPKTDTIKCNIYLSETIY